MGAATKLSASGALATFILAAALQLWNQRYINRLPSDQTHTWRVLKDLWTDEEIDKIQDALKVVGETQGVPNGNQYGYGRWPITEHIGEAEPLREDGTCANRYLVPNNNRTQCILHHRMDVGLSYVFTGGRYGYNEHPEHLASRSAVFFVPLYKMRKDYSGMGTSGEDPMVEAYSAVRSAVPGAEKILRDERLRSAVKAVCGDGYDEIGKIFQFSFVLNVPGQHLATHYDIPFFWGANRYTLPHWLIVAMSASGLWEETRIHQVQGVAYVHKWSHQTSGAFHFYPNGPGGDAVAVSANKSLATLVDGSVVQHGVDPWQPEAPVPPFTRHQITSLTYNRSIDKWQLIADDEVVALYDMDDLRISLPWRHMCFKDKEELARYEAHTDELTLEDVLSKFEADLRRRGILAMGQPRPEPLAFAWMILKQYVTYPARRSLMPVNPCLIAAAPGIGKLFSGLC